MLADQGLTPAEISQIQDIDIVLASSSPRRRQLLAQLLGSKQFTVLVSNADETIYADETPEVATERLSLKKAHAVRELRPQSLVIAADTVVCLDQDSKWHILGKPVDREEAAATLSLLSGKTHQVVTGLSVIFKSAERIKAVSTKVTFRALSRTEIEAYVATDEPYDKAGGYAIQGLARSFVEGLDGSESNVVGLPLAEPKGPFTR